MFKKILKKKKDKESEIILSEIVVASSSANTQYNAMDPLSFCTCLPFNCVTKPLDTAPFWCCGWVGEKRKCKSFSERRQQVLWPYKCKNIKINQQQTKRKQTQMQATSKPNNKYNGKYKVPSSCRFHSLLQQTRTELRLQKLCRPFCDLMCS